MNHAISAKKIRIINALIHGFKVAFADADSDWLKDSVSGNNITLSK
jgi:hypothetical protein